MMLFKAGDHIVCGENVYGGTYRLFDKIYRNFGLTFSFVDTRDPQKIEDAMTPQTVALVLETPTNPLMRITDLAAASAIAKRKGAMMIVDNTFATPVFQRPLESGADIVYHSTTKYLNGHSDMIGAIAVPDQIHFSDALPKTRSGKIMRRLLRDVANGVESKGDMTTLEDLNVLAKLRQQEEE